MKYTAKLINDEMKKNAQTIIEREERLYYKKIENLAEQIISNKNNKIILLSGPSASGKTTTAHILRDYLYTRGVRTHVISLDNFYLSPSNMKRLADGTYDFEAVESLDIDEIHRSFTELINKGESNIPVFDFMIAQRKEERLNIKLGDGEMAIVEGLHALNPILCRDLPTDNLFKIYISITSEVIDNEGNKIIGGRNLRLMRRMSRDYIYRNSSAENTLNMWEGVLNGERKYLHPFKNSADFVFDTFHTFEPCIFKNTVVDLIKSINPQHPSIRYVNAISKAIEQFDSVDQLMIPPGSLIREFIAGGKYE